MFSLNSYQKRALILHKKSHDCIHIWVKQKTPKVFPAGPVFLVLFAKCLSKCPDSTKLPLLLRISGFAPKIIWTCYNHNDHHILKILPTSNYFKNSRKLYRYFKEILNSFMTQIPIM